MRKPAALELGVERGQEVNKETMISDLRGEIVVEVQTVDGRRNGKLTLFIVDQ